MRPRDLVLVAAGGALGAIARNLVDDAFGVARGDLPHATLVVNLVGAALLGLAHSGLLTRRPSWRPFLAAGLLASFTTFSAFAVEVVDLVRLDQLSTAVAYSAATLAGGIALAYAGLKIGERSLRVGDS